MLWSMRVGAVSQDKNAAARASPDEQTTSSYQSSFLRDLPTSSQSMSQTQVSVTDLDLPQLAEVKKQLDEVQPVPISNELLRRLRPFILNLASLRS